MQQVTVGTKYQVVIPKKIRKKVKGLRPGTKVSIYPIDSETLAVKTTKKNWSDESYGFMKEAWKGVDTAAEINKMRDEWQQP